jgi:transcription factor SFP1
MPAMVSADSNDYRETEIRFCKDFSCCGITLPSLHDLLQHYEEVHVCLEEEVQDEQGSQELANAESLDQEWFSQTQNVGRRLSMGWTLEADDKAAFQNVVYCASDNKLKRKRSEEFSEERQEEEKEVKKEKILWISELPDIPHPPISVITPGVDELEAESLSVESLPVLHAEDASLESIESITAAVNAVTAAAAAAEAASPTLHYSVPSFLSQSSPPELPILPMPHPVPLSQHPPTPSSSPAILPTAFSSATPNDKKNLRPHKCPIPGCDKAYKNSNGLKYHAAVSLAGLSDAKV